jgi:hypothetical protein
MQNIFLNNLTWYLPYNLMEILNQKNLLQMKRLLFLLTAGILLFGSSCRYPASSTLYFYCSIHYLANVFVR